MNKNAKTCYFMAVAAIVLMTGCDFNAWTQTAGTTQANASQPRQWWIADSRLTDCFAVNDGVAYRIEKITAEGGIPKIREEKNRYGAIKSVRVSNGEVFWTYYSTQGDCENENVPIRMADKYR